MRRGSCRTGLGVAAALALGVGASPANGVERFAAPDGVPSTSCLIAAPCDIQSAVEGAVANDVKAGDVVTLLPGNAPYVAGAAADDRITINKDIDVRGAPGQPRPMLTSGSSEGGIFMQADGSSLKRLEIIHTQVPAGATDALTLGNDVDVEQVIARSATGSAASAGCTINAGTNASPSIRDSVCVSTDPDPAPDATDTTGLSIVQNAAGSATVLVRNVTAIGAKFGLALDAGAGASLTVTVTSTILMGGTTDVRSEGFGNAPMTIDHSNYDTHARLGNGTLTSPGTGTNQEILPVFADGDFHQASNSPTIDNGSGAAGLGSGDIDDEPRCMGSVPDIGADEFTLGSCDVDGDGVPNINDACPNEAGPASNAGCQPTTPPPDETSPDNSPGDTRAPQTSITKGPKARITSTKALFRFASNEPGSSFECKLDKARWKVCRPPQKLTGLDRGEHSFRVRAVDPAGNVDKSPARRNFKIESKRKRR